MDEQRWRFAWAEYFEARAAKSRKNGDAHPQHREIWYAKASTEDECAIVLRMTDRPLTQLLDDLRGPVSAPPSPATQQASTPIEVVGPGSPPEPPFGQVRYLFWKHLDAAQRVRALEAGMGRVLGTDAMPQTHEAEFLRRINDMGALPRLWEAMRGMGVTYVPGRPTPR